MSKFVRNVSLYLLIIIVAVSIIDAFTSSKTDKSEISYTNFMSQVQQKKVDAVQITADHAIVGQLKTERPLLHTPRPIRPSCRLCAMLMSTSSPNRPNSLRGG